MASLFGKNKLRDIASKLNTQSLEEKIAIVKTWHNDYHNGSLKQDKETSREQAYNQDFFIKILGYKEKPAIPYSFEPKASTLNGQLPDAVIGYTNVSENIANISAVIELKGASVFLERPQRREGNMSPIQQAFKYKTQYRNCPFVIVSNFWEFRLYRDNQLDYEIWTLDDLVDPEDGYLKFKTFYTLLHSDNFISLKGTSKTEDLLSDIRFEQEEIGKKFYKVYRDARLELLRDIYKKNSTVRSDIDMGIKKAQKIIDRIVFACFAEDRGLLPDNTLHRVIKAADNSAFGGSLWNTLKGFFEAIDVGSEKLEIPDGYNGGLFKKDETLDNLQISDEALHAVIDLSNYNFAEDLSVTILGHIFEQSISDLEEIKNKVNESQNIEDLQQSRRKKDGIFYTPDYIVRYIVENSLGAYLREHEEKFKDEFSLKGDINDQNYEKREKQAYSKYQQFLQKVKIVDPACGSGAFLVYVVDYLLAENERVASILGNNLFSIDEYVKSILQNNIYGVDLNEESVEITKLSLWLKTAKKGKKLTALDNNIKCGNSLIDDASVVGDKAFNWKEEFSEIFDSGGFDVVVGNPPYVRQELIAPYKSYFADNYKVFAGTTDLFAYFYEKALDILKPNGVMSFISNTFARTTGAGEVLRKYLQDNARFEKMLDFSALKIFDGATTYPIIVVLRKSTTKESFDYFAAEKGDLGTLDSGFRAKSFAVKQNDLNPKSWTFEDESLTKLREKISIHKTVAEQYGKNYRGILTGLNEAFIINDSKRKELVSADSKSAELIKPFWEGKDIVRWSSSVNDKYIIGIEQGSTKTLFGELSESDAYASMVKKYPAIMSHLMIYEALAKKRYDKGDYWWELRSCAYYKLFEQPKITWPNLQSRNKFCFDNSGKYINAPAVILASGDKALLGVLNSKVVWFFLSGVCAVRSGGYIEVKPQYFEQIPVPEINDIVHKKLESYVEAIIEDTRKLETSSYRFQNLICSEFKLKKFPNKLNMWWTLDINALIAVLKGKLSLQQKDELVNLFEKYRIECTGLDEQIKKNDQEINKLVYELYNLTPEEIRIVENA
jgi:hypothetical protein